MTARLKVTTVSGQGIPLVLLHGFGGAGEDWSGIAEALAGAPLLIPDLPGHGGSMTYPEAGPPKVAANAVLAELEAAGHARVHLAGHSMGGAIATLIALAAPDRVASLTLFAPGGYGPEINHRLLMRYAKAKDPDAMRAVLEGMTGYRFVVPDELVAQKLAQHAAPGQRPLLEAFAAGMVRDGRQGTIPRDRIAALPMPVRLVWGEQDNVLPIRQAAGLPEHFVVTRLAETGHLPAAEQPDAVVAALRDALAG